MRHQTRHSNDPIQYRWVVCLFIVMTSVTLVIPVQGADPDEGTPPLPQSSSRSGITLSIEQKPLADVLSAIQRQSGVAVTGLEDRFQEPVSFSAETEPVETAIKRLLRNLDETNYAFFYNLTQLSRVSVLPKSKAGTAGPVETSVAEIMPAPEPPVLPVSEDARERAVRVIKVNAGTQADVLELRQGDLLVEYDGVRIQSSQQLVSAVKEKSEEDSVEMVVVREGEPIRMTLNGGLIGVNVKTVVVPESEMERE